MMRKYFKKRRIAKNEALLKRYDELGFHRERLDIHKAVWTIFTKDFEEGDEIYWLGHDLVYGLMYGQTLIADKEAVELKNNVSFWKKIDELNFD